VPGSDLETNLRRTNPLPQRYSPWFRNSGCGNGWGYVCEGMERISFFMMFPRGEDIWMPLLRALQRQKTRMTHNKKRNGLM
jgi:hypothetical protein